MYMAIGYVLDVAIKVSINVSCTEDIYFESMKFLIKEVSFQIDLNTNLFAK